MKIKTIILLTSILMLFCIPAEAHFRHYFKAYSYAKRTKLRGGWSDWSKFKNCNIVIEVPSSTSTCENAFIEFTNRLTFRFGEKSFISSVIGEITIPLMLTKMANWLMQNIFLQQSIKDITIVSTKEFLSSFLEKIMETCKSTFFYKNESLCYKIIPVCYNYY